MKSVAAHDSTVRLLSAVAFTIALGAAGTWLAGDWRLCALGKEWVPMAPLTVLVLLLLSGSMFVSTSFAGRQISAWTGWLVSILVLAAAVFIWAPVLTGWNPPLESWLTSTRDTVGSIPVGRMSKLTASIAILAGLALLFRLQPFDRRSGFRFLQPLLSVVVLFASLFVVGSYVADVPFLYGGNIVPMALSTAVAFAFLGAAMLAAAWPDLWIRRLFVQEFPEEKPERLRWVERDTIALFLILFVLVGMSGFLSLRSQKAEHEKRVTEELLTIADLKIKQISGWGFERISDGMLFHQAFVFANQVQAFFRYPSDTILKSEIRGWMDPLVGGGQYASAQLYDRNLRLLLESGEPVQINAMDLSTALEFGNVAMTDLKHAPEGGPIRFSVLVPLFPVGMRGRKAEPAGILVLIVNPDRFLYPLIQSWPVPSRTAETLLVRRDRGEVLFLTQLRHRKNTALEYRIPTANQSIDAVQAILGKEGVLRGKDYRGVNVLSVIHRVPDTPWIMITKEDLSEINAPLHRKALVTGLMIAGFMTASLAGFLAFSHRRVARLLMQKLAAERERSFVVDRLVNLIRNANDAILLSDGEWNILEANERAVKIYGYSVEEIRRMKLPDLRSPAEKAGFIRQMEAVIASDGRVYETVHRHRNGTEFPVEISARLVRVDDGLRFQTIIRDIGERKRIQDELEKRAADLAIANQNLSRLNVELACSRNNALNLMNDAVKANLDAENANAALRAEIEEKKRIQEELCRSEEKYRFIFNNIQDVYYEVMLDGTILEISPSIALFSQYRRENLLSRSLYDFFAWKEDYARLLDQILKTGHVSDYEVLLFDGGTAVVPCSVIARLITQPDGTPDRIVGSMRDIRERKKYEERILSSLHEKEILLKEVHHRVKNNMQLILSLINLQCNKIDDLSALDSLEEIRNRIHSMALLHEELYHSESYSEISFGPYLESLAGKLLSTLQAEKHIDLSFDIESLTLGLDMAIPCGLIVNEIVTNAIKHAFPAGERGTITISFKRKSEEAIELTVKDDGIGLPTGFEPSKAESLGITIIHILAQQIDAMLRIETKGGTRFVITLPVPVGGLKTDTENRTGKG